MMVLPGPADKATPVVALMVATAVLLLLPLLVKAVDEPLHIVASLTVPATGRAFTMIVFEVEGMDMQLPETV